MATSPKSLFANLPAPPVAAKKPVSDTRHGMTRTDDYAWFRADNWQAMFKDPTILDPEIRQHLEAENAYMEAAMGDTAELQKALFNEMRGRIKEDDSSVPMKDGPYAYGSLFVTGGEQPHYFRTPRDGGDWEILTASAFVTILVPLAVFFSLQRYFVRGLLAGSVKGG